MEANSVEIIESENNLIVRVIENGCVVDKRFKIRDFALSWAAGQSSRLRLAKRIELGC